MSCLYYPVKKQADTKGVIYQNTFYSVSPTVGRKGILVPLPKNKIPVNKLLFYLPLQQKTNKAQTGQQVSFVNGAAFTYTQFDAVKCLNLPASATSAYIRTKIDVHQDKSFTLSFHAQIYHTQKSTSVNLISINNQTACIRVQTNNVVSFGVYNEGQLVSEVLSGSISNLIWHCIQVTFDGISTVSCYIDNTLISTKTVPLSFDTQSIQLNISALGDKSFAGNLAGIRIYNAALTASQLKALCNQFRGLYTFIPLKSAQIPPVNTKGILVANRKPFYKRNQRTISTAKQVFYCSGQTATATTDMSVVGQPQLQRIQGIPCIHSQDGVLLYNNTVTFTTDNGFTLSTYVYSDYGTGNMAFLSVGCHQYRQTIQLYVQDNQLRLYQQYGNPNHIRCEMPKNKWVHVAVVYSGQYIQLFLQGESVGRGRSNGQWTTCRGVCLFGAFDNSWNKYPRDAYFKGALADVRIFNTQLTKAQIQLLARTFIQDTAVKAFIPIKADPDKYPTDNLMFHHPLDKALTTLPTYQTVYNQIVQCHTVQNSIPCKFFGGNSFITLNDAPQAHIPILSKYDCTITFWAKSCSIDQCRQLHFGQDTSYPNNRQIYLFCTNGKQRIQIKGSSSWQSSIQIDPDKWYFYCFTYRAEDGYLKVQVADAGDSVTSKWITSDWTVNNFLTIGADGSYQRYVWTGFMAGLRIYDKILPSADIKLLASQFTPDYTAIPEVQNTLSDSSLVLYADMNKADKIPTGQTVTINGYQCYRTIANIPCFWFGADTRYDLTTQKLPTGYTAFTVSAWFYTCFDTERSWQDIWNMGDTNRSRYRNSQFYIYSNNTVGPHFGSGDYQNFVQTSNKYQWQKWQHAVMTYDTQKAKFYINGQLLYSNYRALNLNTVLFNMGTEPGNTRDNKYKGYIADVRVYNRAVTQTQVQTLYNMHKDAVQDKKLLFHLKCDSFKAQTGQDILKYDRGNYTVNLVTQDGIPAYQFPQGNSYNCAVVQETYNFPYGDNVPFTVAAWSKLPQKPDNYIGVFSLGIKTSGWQYSQQLCIAWQWPIQRFKFCYYDKDKREHVNLLTSWDYRSSWYHILASYDGQIFSIYTNNVLTVQKAVNIHVQPRYMMLGKLVHDYYVQYKNGFISDVRVYNKSLSKAQATQVYNYQKPTDVAQLYTKQEHLIIYTPLDGFMPRQALTGQQYTPVKYRPYPQKNRKECLQLAQAMTIPDNTVYTKISIFLAVYLQTSQQLVSVVSVGDLQLNMLNGLLQLTKGTQTFTMSQVFQDGWQSLSLISDDLKTFDLYLGTYKVLSATYTDKLNTFQFVLRKAL